MNDALRGVADPWHFLQKNSKHPEAARLQEHLRDLDDGDQGHRSAVAAEAELAQRRRPSCFQFRAAAAYLHIACIHIELVSHPAQQRLEVVRGEQAGN
eukprot:CAMPEP_0180786906 /NCGR_PEP_ID=MMETSP1038_2-20121128/51077_1 /TAXON_ID=632150 /ORGANISM="Azadinium spinosum, Strain 3D9" /LENGTH=97 /DNA_ID=CAMNT_0022824113 /DNA_START=330 /DNA_END=623 /DNA_ORIENTATION=-